MQEGEEGEEPGRVQRSRESQHGRHEHAGFEHRGWDCHS